METVITNKIEAFFEAYAARFNRALGENPEIDVEATASAFADCFVESSPMGVSCGKNDDAFRAAIPTGNEFYRSVGTKAMNIVEMAATPLDDYHWMVRVHWDSHYEKPDSGEDVQIDFAVIYLLTTLSGDPKIFAYITGDEQKVLKEKGLIPA